MPVDKKAGSDKKAGRDKKVFQGPGQDDAIIPSEASVAAELFDPDVAGGGPDWEGTFSLITVGDMMALSGFHEKNSPRRKRWNKLQVEDLAKVVKALESHNGMNYHRSAGYGEYACAACCTCWPI